MTKIPNRSFVQLAEEINYNKTALGGNYLSEKLDGQRGLWDGGITRGIPIRDVPWANVEKESRLLTERTCTGLWSRYGHPIIAPDWWLDGLPNIPLDGELYLGRRRFHELVSATKKLTPVDSEWENVKFLVFDSPAYSEIFESGVINEVNFKKIITPAMLNDFLPKLALTVPRPFDSKWAYLTSKQFNDPVVLHEQIKLPYDELSARKLVEDKLSVITSLGGEGLILRDSSSYWVPKRKYLYKIKELQDAEAIVVGYKTGELGKYHGMLGSLTVRFNQVTFDLSGFTDEERTLIPDVRLWALSNPGKPIPATYGSASKHFGLSETVTFKYRELTPDNVPREARYLRRLAD